MDHKPDKAAAHDALYIPNVEVDEDERVLQSLFLAKLLFLFQDVSQLMSVSNKSVQ